MNTKGIDKLEDCNFLFEVNSVLFKRIGCIPLAHVWHKTADMGMRIGRYVTNVSCYDGYSDPTIVLRDRHISEMFLYKSPLRQA